MDAHIQDSSLLHPQSLGYKIGEAYSTPGSLKGKNHPLGGIVHKILRAEEHLARISTEVKRHKGECQIGRRKNVNPSFVDLIAEFPEPPVMLSVIVGDCLYNLRSALDHLVWQLVESNPPNRGIARNQYPICRDRLSFDREIKGHRLDGVPASAKDVIEHLQPYNEGHDYSSHPLWLLDQLINIDKHRFLTLTCVTTQDLLGLVKYRINPHGPLICSVNSVDCDNLEKQLKDGLSIAFKQPPAAGLDVAIQIQVILAYLENHLLPSFRSFFN